MPWKTRLVGRASEIAELEGERRRAAGGQFCCVLLAGDPGFGKTRLAMEALQRAPRSTIRMSARAYSLGEAAAFGVWAEALESHLGSLSAADVSRLCGGWLDDLASLLRSVACLRGSAPQREPPRSRLLEGLAVLLARQAPVVVVLDDVHLADPSLWEGLHYLARNLPTHRVLVIAAARPVELSEARAASRVLLALEQDGLLHRVNVGPLGEAAVPELAEAVLEDKPPKVLVDWLWQRSRGTPLFALGLLQALIDEGADLTAPQLRSLPEGLADRVASRLELLDEPTLSILEILSVLGRRVELEELLGPAPRPPEELGPILQALRRSRLVTEEERGRELTYEIAHPLVQETIYQSIGSARRRTLHRLVGRALLAWGRRGEAASHFTRSAKPGDLAERVAPHKKVRRLEVIDQIPKSPSGKILRRLLVERERADQAELLGAR